MEKLIITIPTYTNIFSKIILTKSNMNRGQFVDYLKTMGVEMHGISYRSPEEVDSIPELLRNKDFSGGIGKVVKSIWNVANDGDNNEDCELLMAIVLFENKNAFKDRMTGKINDRWLSKSTFKRNAAINMIKVLKIVRDNPDHKFHKWQKRLINRLERIETAEIVSSMIEDSFYVQPDFDHEFYEWLESQTKRLERIKNTESVSSISFIDEQSSSVSSCSSCSSCSIDSSYSIDSSCSIDSSSSSSNSGSHN